MHKTHTHTYTHARTHKYTHTYAYTHIYTHIYTCTYTYAHTRVRTIILTWGDHGCCMNQVEWIILFSSSGVTLHGSLVIAMATS